jgi:hypothetical protein
MRNPTHRHLLALAAALLALMAVACQGAGDSGPADDAAQAISNDELAQMGLALGDFGADSVSFQPDEDNGIRTLDQVADDDFDPEDERADLERFSWAAGYQEFYLGAQAMAETSGVFVVGSSVNLFETVEGASGYLEDSRAELRTQVGKTNKGVTVQDIQEFDADIADGAVGAVFQGSVEAEQGSSTRFWISALTFRHGRLVATVGIYSFEEGQFQDRLKGLGRQLDQYIGSVLSGKAPAKPTP